MKRAWYKYRKRECLNSCEFHERVPGIYGIMHFDPNIYSNIILKYANENKN